MASWGSRGTIRALSVVAVTASVGSTVGLLIANGPEK